MIIDIASTSGSSEGHVGIVAIVGRPNVGKSTLLNRLLGEKVAIVSHLPQTTRNRVLGVKTWGGNQLVLLDTPGIHRRRANMNRFMVQEALDSLGGVDCVLLMTEVSAAARVKPEEVKPELHPDDVYVLEQVKRHQPEAPTIVAVNKIDLLRDRRALLPLLAGWSERGETEMVPISASTGDGVDALVEAILARLPRGPLLYPEETLTNRTERFLCAELIREQVFEHFRQEVPYSTAVDVEHFEERPGREGERGRGGPSEARYASEATQRARRASAFGGGASRGGRREGERGGDTPEVRIEAVIFVERESQKAILIGKGGAAIKMIGIAARQEIARLLGCTVHLQLTVRVAEAWTRSPAGRRRFGYEP